MNDNNIQNPTEQDKIWWDSLDYLYLGDLWKKWFNFHIGKPKDPFKIQDISAMNTNDKLNMSDFIREKGRIDEPTPEELKQIFNLTVFHLYANKIKRIGPLRPLTQLQTLDLSSNRIVYIDCLYYLKRLKTLYLRNNTINNIGPLESLTQLHTLYLDLNYIVDLQPLESLTQLKILNLESNRIENINALKSLTQLEKLYLKKNPITENQKTDLRKALPNCDISF